LLDFGEDGIGVGGIGSALSIELLVCILSDNGRFAGWVSYAMRERRGMSDNICPFVIFAPFPLVYEGEGSRGVFFSYLLCFEGRWEGG